MRNPALLALALAITATVAHAQTLTTDGFTAQGVLTTPVNHDRVGLVNDGSFEFGECGAGSAWTCTTDNPTCSTVSATVDGTAIWSHVMQTSEHTYGTWNTASSHGWIVNLAPYVGQSVDFCFQEVACPDGFSNDNMLIDYVVVLGLDATESASISTVKALY